MQTYVYLSPTLAIRSRAVYNIVDMIAEVSGLADVLYLTTSSFMTFSFTIRVLNSFLVYHIGKVLLQKDESQHTPDQERDSLLSRAVTEIKSRFRLKLTLWQTLVAYYLPRKLRSESTNEMLDLADLNLKRMDNSLDVVKIIESQLDL